ncbi:hypothetical protein LTR85_007923 [Meristemomyces frigidus]|nr:hypothetical protein LTR85_007923 [Meristemomyces frigidus]
MAQKNRAQEERGDVDKPNKPALAAQTKPQAKGFKQWRTTTKLASGGKLTEMSGASKFSQTVKIQHTDAFSLRPVTLTEGPLAGRHVLVLDPISIFFRFMDLPAEIRQSSTISCSGKRTT